MVRKTLRRVPHLTVTWAHQPAATSQGLTPTYQAQSSPSYSFRIQHRPLPSHTFASPNGSMTSYSQPSKSGIEIVDGAATIVDRAQHSRTFFDQVPAVRKAATLTSTISAVEKRDLKQLINCQLSWADGESPSASGPVEVNGTARDAIGLQDEPQESLEYVF